MIREFSPVTPSAHSIRSISPGDTGSARRPMKRIRTPSSCSSGVSRSIRRANISISADTSSAGRAQFSVENEYTVSSSMPELDRVAQPRLDGVGAGLVARDDGQPALRGPSGRCRR